MNRHWTIGIGPVLRSGMAVALALASTWAAFDVHAQTSADSAGASANATPSRARASDIGRATRTWLELQRTNAAAAPALPMPGAQATLAYERYMNSFRNKIPASFGSALSSEGDTSRFGYTDTGSGSTPPPGAN
ncbi:DUF3613 domain-containing protein [Trinickia dinghuensis]